VLLYGVDPAKDPFLTKPLRREARIETHKGTIVHDGIIGKQVRDVVTTNKGVGGVRVLCGQELMDCCGKVELTGFNCQLSPTMLL